MINPRLVVFLNKPVSLILTLLKFKIFNLSSDNSPLRLLLLASDNDSNFSRLFNASILLILFELNSKKSKSFILEILVTSDILHLFKFKECKFSTS